MNDQHCQAVLLGNQLMGCPPQDNFVVPGSCRFIRVAVGRCTETLCGDDPATKPQRLLFVFEQDVTRIWARSEPGKTQNLTLTMKWVKAVCVRCLDVLLQAHEEELKRAHGRKTSLEKVRSFFEETREKGQAS